MAGAGGARVGWQVGTLEEARAACDAGCAYLIVQGVEAGGHVRGRERLLLLLERGVQSAADIVEELVAGAAALLHPTA